MVRLETRPPNLEGEGQITMRDLVRNCLRMRPERIIVGEVRGPEAFDLLQAMNTGHDGSMGTLHANSPREALSRLESMITMGGYSLPSRTIREMICASIDVIIQAARLRDGSRRITHITEVMGMEGDVIITQDLFVYDILGEDANGNLWDSTGRPVSGGRSSGTGRAITAKTCGSRPRSTLRKPRPELEIEEAARAHETYGLSLWWLSRSVGSRGSSSIRFCPANGTPNVAWRASRAPSRWRRARFAAAQKIRREQVEGTLKQLEARQKKAKRVPLSVRIAQAGLDWSTRRFMMTAGTLGRRRLLGGDFCWAPVCCPRSGLALRPAAGLPLWLLSFLKKRREARFLDAFPDAVDVIVRGIKAGLPLLDSLKLIASEAQEPIRSEIRAIIDTQTIGIPLGEACLRLYERMPLPEANFFGIVISIQQRAGGNLSEALGNLSRVLRDRKKMKAKIKAMSQEAKASAAIIGALPIAVMSLVYVTSPDYISMLWTESLGRMMLACSAVWMSIGIFVMRKMINFDF